MPTTETKENKRGFRVSDGWVLGDWKHPKNQLKEDAFLDLYEEYTRIYLLIKNIEHLSIYKVHLENLELFLQQKQD
jgi:hypothetical protein